MYQASIENSKGDSLQLTGDEANYQILNIEGLNPPQAQVNFTNIAGMDGAKFNSAKLQTRELVITIKINGNAEANRLRLYQVFPTKEQVTFYYSNSTRDVFIKGYVNSCEVNPFSRSEQMQISIICPQPYFKDMNEIITDISDITALFEFPFSINLNEPIPFSAFKSGKISTVFNTSDVQTGVMIQIDISSSVNDIRIVNTVTGDFFELNYAFQAGDRVTINTNSGEKSVQLLRNGETLNIFSAIVTGSTFLQLEPGINSLGYRVDNGANDQYANIFFSFYSMYRGV